jgi:hypothetical protein
VSINLIIKRKNVVKYDNILDIPPSEVVEIVEEWMSEPVDYIVNIKTEHNGSKMITTSELEANKEGWDSNTCADVLVSFDDPSDILIFIRGLECSAPHTQKTVVPR